MSRQEDSTRKSGDSNNPEELQEDELFIHHHFKADEGQQLLRIDKFLQAKIANVTRSKVQDAIREGFVKVNGQQIKPNHRVHPGDDIIVWLPQPPRDTEVKPEEIPIDIVHEDNDILIVNKPAGMVVHPAFNNWTGTLVNALVYHFSQLPTMRNNEGRPGLVHRIDKDTSGLLVIAKNDKSMTHLARQFFDHTIDRTYQAIIWGVPSQDQGTIDKNLGRSLKDRRITTTYDEPEKGRRAVTHYKVLRDLRYVSLVQCTLETGRTHQIRAHMKYLGHPIFNDQMYGGDRILKGTVFSKYKSFVTNCFKIMARQALHASTLGFVHPGTGKRVEFDSDPPQDFTEVLSKWQHYVQYN